MRDRIREWHRNRQRPVGLNSVADADEFAAKLRDLRDDDTRPIPAVRPDTDTAGEIPVVAPESGPDPAPVARGLCSRCTKPVKLRKDGTVAAHRNCDGGGREPLALAECTVCAALELPVFAATLHGRGHPVLVWDGDAA